MILYGETNSSSVWNGTCPLGSPACDGGTLREGVLAELLVLLRDRRVERQILGRDDLVGVDVVAQDVGLAGDGRLHVMLQCRMRCEQYAESADRPASCSCIGVIADTRADR